MAENRQNGFKPGNTLSLGRGRPLGSKNRKASLQAMTAKSLAEKMADLDQEYWHMSISQKLRYFEIMMPYGTPRLQATNINKWEEKSEEELEAIALNLMKNLKKERETLQIKSNGKITEAQ